MCIEAIKEAFGEPPVWAGDLPIECQPRRIRERWQYRAAWYQGGLDAIIAIMVLDELE